MKKEERAREKSWIGGLFGKGIALSGLPAKVQPHGLLEPGRRCVETSGDVICLAFMKRSEKCQHLFFVRRTSCAGPGTR
jgi:hypothetical protein